MRVSNIIEDVLREDVGARSSDKELYLQVWERLGFYLSDTQKAKFRNLPSTETIRRVRQKLQEQGFYLATDRVRRSRHFKSLEVQQRIPQTKPERVEPMLEHFTKEPTQPKLL